VLFTVVEGPGAGAKRLVVEGGEQLGDGVPQEALGQFDEILRRGRNQLVELEDGSKVFAEWYGPPPRLFVYGAVDTAEALCKAAKLLGWTAIVADARAKFATAERIPSADRLIVEWPDEALAQVEPDHQTRRRPHPRRQVRQPGAQGRPGRRLLHQTLGSRRSQERGGSGCSRRSGGGRDSSGSLGAVRPRPRRRARPEAARSIPPRWSLYGPAAKAGRSSAEDTNPRRS
jgi:hypothetical protein